MDRFAEKVNTWLQQISGFDTAEELAREQRYTTAKSMFDKIK